MAIGRRAGSGELHVKRTLVPVPRPAAVGRDTSGVAPLEFALVLPFLLAHGLTGAELTNYIITKMRDQPDRAAPGRQRRADRVGHQLRSRDLRERHQRPVHRGQLQAGELDLYANGRVIIISLEPRPPTRRQVQDRWQRCKGPRPRCLELRHAGDGRPSRPAWARPAGRSSRPPGRRDVRRGRLRLSAAGQDLASPTTDMTEIASMMVRDRRDTSDDSKYR